MAICVALIVVCSWLSFPLAVPITLQTFAIFSILGLLGGKRGTVVIVCYVVLGALGLPVFSNFKGGIGVILHNVSGGYIIGFTFVAISYWIAVSVFGRKPTVEFVSLAIGMVLCYLAGTCWYMWLNVSKSGALDFLNVLYVCVLPFILPDLIKLCVSLTLVTKLRKHLKL